MHAVVQCHDIVRTQHADGGQVEAREKLREERRERVEYPHRQAVHQRLCVPPPDRLPYNAFRPRYSEMRS